MSNVPPEIMNRIRALSDVGSDSVRHAHHQHDVRRTVETPAQPEVDHDDHQPVIQRLIGNLTRRVVSAEEGLET